MHGWMHDDVGLPPFGGGRRGGRGGSGGSLGVGRSHGTGDGKSFLLVGRIPRLEAIRLHEFGRSSPARGELGRRQPRRVVLVAQHRSSVSLFRHLVVSLAREKCVCVALCGGGVCGVVASCRVSRVASRFLFWDILDAFVGCLVAQTHTCPSVGRLKWWRWAPLAANPHGTHEIALAAASRGPAQPRHSLPPKNQHSRHDRGRPSSACSLHGSCSHHLCPVNPMYRGCASISGPCQVDLIRSAPCSDPCFCRFH